MGLRVYNTLGRRLEDFVPVHPPRVGIYVCGPTVYGHSHLGHAKSYVGFDAIIRWLRFIGYNVSYVQNITDVGHLTDNADEGEDKIVAEARRRGLHPMAVVEVFMRSYLEDMDALNIARPDIMPRASGHIPEQIEAVRKLLETRHAYEVNGNIYFDVQSFPGYGKLSGRNVAELEAGARVAVNEEKRHPADFALWKRAEPGHIMRWPSPWGAGYPGWHLECSVMSQKYIGDTLDIHGGGLENQFPHHECEIAQAESLTGKPFVKYWLHNNMVTLNGQKMGKSLGNAISLKEIFRAGHPLLEKTFEPAVIKHFILTSHYRANLDFSNEALKGAESGCYKLRDALRELAHAAGVKAGVNAGSGTLSPGGESGLAGEQRASAGHGPDSFPRFSPAAKTGAIRTVLFEAEERFAASMSDDFNTAAAIAAVFELVRQTQNWVHDAAPREDLLAAYRLMQALTGDVLGLRWEEPIASGDEEARDKLIQLLVDLRNEARKARNFELGDQIRQRLSAIGVELKDTAKGTVW